MAERVHDTGQFLVGQPGPVRIQHLDPEAREPHRPVVRRLVERRLDLATGHHHQERREALVAACRDSPVPTSGRRLAQRSAGRRSSPGSHRRRPPRRCRATGLADHGGHRHRQASRTAQQQHDPPRPYGAARTGPSHHRQVGATTARLPHPPRPTCPALTRRIHGHGTGFLPLIRHRPPPETARPAANPAPARTGRTPGERTLPRPGAATDHTPSHTHRACRLPPTAVVICRFVGRRTTQGVHVRPDSLPCPPRRRRPWRAGTPPPQAPGGRAARRPFTSRTHGTTSDNTG